MAHPKDAVFTWRRSPDQARPQPAHHAIVIVGAGPVGLAAALELAKSGQRSVVIDKKNTLSDGSRAICWSKRTLEIMDRLGVGQDLLDKGVTWKNGKVFFDTRAVYQFDLAPDADHRMPAFINLQQYYFEHYCLAAAAKTGLIDIRWLEEVVGLAVTSSGALLDISTPEGAYRLNAAWVIAADGARSTLRRLLGLGFEGRVFGDQFLICDIKMQMQRPIERWFWFDPPFNRGRSALLHKQADDVWRLDFQIGNEADREFELKPENVARRVRSMLGEDIEFTFEWISLYRYQSRRLQRFRHDRILFAGDCAHQVSPFGARGGNSGVQDADNLAWKLDLVMRGQAPDRLLDSYDEERAFAADENLLHTTRSTDFIAPKSAASRYFRDGVLALAQTEPFARALVNSGRLSLPACYQDSSLNTAEGFEKGECEAVRPGAAAVDAPCDGDWFLRAMGSGFAGVWFDPEGHVRPEVASGQAALAQHPLPVTPLMVSQPTACARYGACQQPAYYLFRPDQHVAGRWRGFDQGAVAAALDRAIAKS
jgi:3-(3-hydroxy-phenyl)propionate hydroxylase